VRSFVEGFDGGDGGDCAIDEGCCRCGLGALDGEEGLGTGLGEALDYDEDGDGGDDDEGDAPGAGECEDEAGDAGREVLDEHA
jgi:hypothetical protein